MSESNHKLCIIDRFEGNWAVVEYEDKTFNFPKKLLPENAKEGDVLSFNVQIDEKKTGNRKKNKLYIIEYDEELYAYIENFNMHYKLMLKRFFEFSKLSKNLYQRDINWLTYFDLLIVQLRSLCCENSRYENNYTIQILLRKIGEYKLADQVDKLLQEELVEEISIRKAIKFIADKFICHYDKIELSDKVLEQTYRNALSYPYNKVNIWYVIGKLHDLLGEGFKIEIGKKEGDYVDR